MFVTDTTGFKIQIVELASEEGSYIVTVEHPPRQNKQYTVSPGRSLSHLIFKIIREKKREREEGND